MNLLRHETLFHKWCCLVFVVSLILHSPTQGATFTNISPLNTSRYLHQAVTLSDGRVLVVGGVSPALERISVVPEIYDPTNGVWMPTQYPSPGDYYFDFSMTLLQSSDVLVVGGSGPGDNTRGRVLIFNPSTGQWTNGPSPITPRSGHTATLLQDGKVLLAGGSGATGHVLTNAEIYSPVTGTWTNTGSMNFARSNHRATLLRNGKVMVTGGGLTSVEIYDPVTGKWAATAPLRVPRSNHTATLLKDGSVILIGNGSSSGSGGRLIEKCDPEGREWRILSLMAKARAGQTTTMLRNGKLLVAGGTGDGGILPTAEFYDPFSDSWSSVPNMSTQRFWHASTLLNDGNVLVIGGAYGASASLRTVDLFDAANLPYDHIVLSPPVKMDNGTFRLSFEYNPGTSVRLFATTNLSASDDAWTEVTGILEVTPGKYQADDSILALPPQRFYRVLIP